MTAYLAYAATSAAAGASMSAISSFASLVNTVKALSVSDHVKQQVQDLDIDATVSTIQLVVKTHPIGSDDYQLARHYVIKALERVKFDLETIHVKTRLHHEGWISRWRKLNLNSERKKLASSIRILKSRFRLMWSLAKSMPQQPVYNSTIPCDYLIT